MLILSQMTKEEVISKLVHYMEKNNLRQWELAKRLGIPEATLNRWLNKRTNISKAYLRILEKEGII